MSRLTISVIVIAISSIAAGSRILGIAPYPSHSHQVVFRSLTTELVRRGHEVVVFTAYTTNLNMTNYREVDLSILTRKWKNTMDFYKIGFEEGIWAFYDAVLDFGGVVSDTVLSHPEMKKILDPKTKEKFDVIMVQQLCYDALNALSIRLNIPIIGVTSLDIIVAQHIQFGHNLMIPYTRHPTTGHRMETLFDRIYQVYFYFRSAYGYYYRNSPLQEAVMRKHFGDTVPSIEKVRTLIDVMLMSSHEYFIENYPLVPGIKHIGGCRFSKHSKKKPMPSDLQTVLDNAKSGFIYFSMGSNVQIGQLPDNVKQGILSTFAELPYTVLWKSDVDLEKSDNVILRKWCPQEQILAHPNIRLFIYQGGLQSTEEALEYAVPLLGMPVFADQFVNIQAVKDHNVAEVLQLKDFTKEAFKEKILKVITDPSYKENVTKLSDLLHDRPQHPLDNAIWWIEHVIRHKGAKHLRSRGQDMEFYKIHHFDIFAVFLGFCISFLAVALLILRFVYRKIMKLINHSVPKTLKKD